MFIVDLFSESKEYMISSVNATWSWLAGKNAVSRV
jgi:hypothetical protein